MKMDKYLEAENYDWRLTINFFRKIFVLILVFAFVAVSLIFANPPIYISFQWHMHQPIYWPYESIVQTEARHAYSYSVISICTSRTGPYTSWPEDAVQNGMNAGLGHLGAQMSFSGSLIENLNNIEAAGAGFSNWKARIKESRSWKTALGNPRLDIVNFGYYHPLMPLVSNEIIEKQILLEQQAIRANFGGPLSKGIFTPENAFAEWIIPPLLKTGIQWVFVDNIHFQRATQNYPYNKGGNLYPPNPADQVNPDPNDWVQLNDVWAPTKVSAAWSYRPHYVEYIDPTTGAVQKIIAVPAARYMGNEDGRGGFGALDYDKVMSQLAAYNTDPKHPILIVLHHDGDNYGGGTDSYYHGNFNNFINWLKANPSRFVATTVQDYLDMFPPEQSDVIHVEPGSWAGADNGDPQFLKWNGAPDPNTGYSPDRNSWSVITAATNIVQTAAAIEPAGGITDILNGTGNNTSKAWHYFLSATASDYWYWDGTEMWDGHPTRASNLAIPFAEKVLSANPNVDTEPPSIYIPQRKPYNPGGYEWSTTPETSDVEIWTFVYDVSGLSGVTLKYRNDKDGFDNPGTKDNELYAGGPDVDAWQDISMQGLLIPSRIQPTPLYQAKRYSAVIRGLSNVLIDYYVQAVDKKGNIARSPIKHVYIGQKVSGGGGNSSGPWSPVSPTKNDTILIYTNKAGDLHWAVNSWTKPATEYLKTNDDITTWPDAVDRPLIDSNSGTYFATVGPFNGADTVSEVDFVFKYADGSWGTNQTINIVNNVSDLPSITINYPAPDQIILSDTIIKFDIAVNANGNVLYENFYIDNNQVVSLSDTQVIIDVSSIDSGLHTLRVSVKNDKNYTVDKIVSFYLEKTVKPVLIGDINPVPDGIVDGNDLMILAVSFGTSSGDSRFNQSADINNDGIIDGNDLMILAQHFGMKK